MVERAVEVAVAAVVVERRRGPRHGRTLRAELGQVQVERLVSEKKKSNHRGALVEN